MSTSTPSKLSMSLPRAAWSVPPSQRLAVLAALVALGLYAWVFALAEVSSFGADPETGRFMTRAEFTILLAQHPSFVTWQWMGGDVGRMGGIDRVPVLAVAGLWIAASLGAGRWFVRRLRWDDACHRYEVWLLSAASGLAISSSVVFLAGVGGLLHYRWLLLAPFAAAWLVTWRQASASTRAVTEVAGESRDDSLDEAPGDGTGGIMRTCWFAALPFLVVSLLAALLPPLVFDAKCYHLQAPKEFLEAGAIGFSEHNVYANMPLGAEMHVLACMLLWPGESDWWYGALGGKVVIAACSWLAGLLVFAIARRLGMARGWSAFAALVYISIPWVHYVSVSGLIDGVLAMYAAATLYCGVRLFQCQDHQSRRHWSLAMGWFSGCAIACKYTALLFVAAPALIAVTIAAGLMRLDASEKGRWRTALANFTLAGLMLLLACGGWLAKNAYHTGNPCYPLLASVASTAHWQEGQSQRWDRVHSPPANDRGATHSLQQLVSSLSQLGWTSNWQSPLLWPLAFFALLFARKQTAVVWLTLLIAAYVLGWWALTHRVDRFWIPVLPAVAVLAAIGASQARTASLRVALIAMIGAGLASNWLVIVSRAMGDNRYLTAYEQLRVDEPQAVDGGYSRTHPVHRWINEVVSPGDVVLLVGDSRPFDIERSVLYSTPFNMGWMERILQGETAAARRRLLHRSGATLIYVAWADIERERSDEGYGFSEWVTRERIAQLVKDQLVRPVETPFPSGAVAVYAVNR